MDSISENNKIRKAFKHICQLISNSHVTNVKKDYNLVYIKPCLVHRNSLIQKLPGEMQS